MPPWSRAKVRYWLNQPKVRSTTRGSNIQPFAGPLRFTISRVQARKLRPTRINSQGLSYLSGLLAQNDKHNEALYLLLEAGKLDTKHASGKVRKPMVQILHILGSNHPASEKFRAKVARYLY